MLTLNLGAGLSTTHNINDLQSAYLDKGSGTWQLAPLLSNSFTFDQGVSYLRGGLTWQAAKGWRLVAYVQPEWTEYDLQNKGQDATAANSYLNWLPGVTIRKDLNKEHNLNLVYRKSIRRPNPSELNPAIDYGDPYNLRFGNPLLAPTNTHNFDLNYGYGKGKSFFNASLGFNLVEDIIASIRTLQPDGKTFVTFQNIASRREYEANVWSGYSFSKTVRVNLSAGYSYNHYTEADRKQYGYRNGGSFYTSINYNLTFSGVFSMDGSMRFNSFADPQGRSRSNVNSHFGVQHKFLDRRLIVSLAVIDPFTRQEVTTTTTGKNFNLESFRSSRTRNMRLTLGWQLNRVVAPKSVPGSGRSKG
jgi:outer membrane receptor protein involved in Fe transport